MLACLLLLQPAYAGAATAEERCLAELAAVPPTAAAVVDVELVVPGIVAKLGAEPFWADIRPISTACRAPGSFPDQYRLDGAGEGRDYVKPIALVRTAGVSGVVFAYMSRGVEETLTGVAAALVEYQPDGTVGRVHKASELLGGEGWARLVTTSFTDQFAERCTQEIDYALYSENGDIVGEREVPDRRPRYCEKVVQFPPRHSPESRVLQRLVEPGRYREAVLHGPAREVRVIKADEGYFEEAEASQISPGGIVRLHEVAAGLVTGADQVLTHDRYYCTFVSVRTGCVYARATGEICDGDWSPGGQWVTAGGEIIDITKWRMTAEEVASGREELGHQIDNSYENLLHCDPPDDRNRAHHQAISE